MNHTTRVYDDVLEMLPSVDNPTPLVRVSRSAPAGSHLALYAKLEWLNPFGSVKDRAAAELVRQLEESGTLSSERGIVEATSGNTGLSLAAICAARGYPMRAVIPNKVPLEKKVLLKIAGAELDVVNDDVCPSPGMGEGSINLAKTHAKARPDRWALPNQYENEQNALAHYRTTGPEIWRQTAGAITHLFVSLGTCGTVTGCARYLKERNPKVRVIAVQPTEGHDVPGLRNLSQLGVSKLFAPELIDEILEVDFELAYSTAAELARRDGLLAGPSSGLVYAGARQVAERLGPEGADRGTERGVAVMIFADNVFKYVSNMVRHLPDLERGTNPYASRTQEGVSR
jgi:cysteine synthase B